MFFRYVSICRSYICSRFPKPEFFSRPQDLSSEGKDSGGRGQADRGHEGHGETDRMEHDPYQVRDPEGEDQGLVGQVTDLGLG